MISLIALEKQIQNHSSLIVKLKKKMKTIKIVYHWDTYVNIHKGIMFNSLTMIFKKFKYPITILQTII